MHDLIEMICIAIRKMNISRRRMQRFFRVCHIDFLVHSIQESPRGDFVNLLNNILD